MTSERSTITKIVPFLKTGEKIPLADMLRALNEATGVAADERRRETASEFIPEAGQYLSGRDLLSFIKADITDAEAQQLIAERKTLIRRLSNLLPEVFNLLAIKDEASINSALMQINDCCVDYHAVKRSAFFSKQHKNIVRDINTTLSLSKELEFVLQRIEHHIDIDFNHHQEAHQRVSDAAFPMIRFYEFQRLLGVLRFSSELLLYKDSIGERAFYIGDNRARTHIVECCYRMAAQFGAPTFATTPGSDFSRLCSLIYEAATGEAEESLAGAINKFARSDLRREIDADEVIARYEHSAEGMAEREADNFAAVRSAIEGYEAEAHFWRKMQASREWDKATQVHIGHRLLDVLARRDEEMKQHGPFLVWASQLRPRYDQELWDMSDELDRLNLELAETLGRRIRFERD